MRPLSLDDRGLHRLSRPAGDRFRSSSSCSLSPARPAQGRRASWTRSRSRSTDRCRGWEASRAPPTSCRSGPAQARVKFEFSIKGKGRYRVARRLKRHAAQSATLERLRGRGVGLGVRADGVRECDRVLGELLGLDFDSFCKAVVLPQGEFHRFLKGDPAERRKVLVSLLGVSYFERMGAIGRARQSDLASKVERTEEIVLDQYGSATPERRRRHARGERRCGRAPAAGSPRRSRSPRSI